MYSERLVLIAVWLLVLCLLHVLFESSDFASIYLRATPTAAGPSSSKRSVLWRTRGFAALGFDCCVVVGAVSGACFV